MNFANDSLQTTLCLQFEPQEIATATVYLAGQFAKIRPVNKSADWLEVLYGHDSSTSSSPDIETLTSICLQIIELIADRKGSDEAAFTKIRRDLETLKQEKQRSSNPPVNQHSPLNQPEAKRQKTGP
jgi:cyclin T